MIHGEITYECEYGNVHSDLVNEEMTDEFRKFLHDCLDEWLENANGTGAFWVGNPEYFNNWGK